MAQVLMFKCPSCGNSLEYQPGVKAVICPFCQTSLNEDDISAPDSFVPDNPMPEVMQSYHCSNCGAEIITDKTTAATRCYYCHSPVILTDRLSETFRPDGVIPFQFDRQQAQEKFREYIRKKHFVRPEFFSEETLQDFAGVYYPYWLADVDMEAALNGEATRVQTRILGNVTEVRTAYYKVTREAMIHVPHLQRKALNAASRLHSDGIQPFGLEDVQPFKPAFLSGFLAEKRDVEMETAQIDMEKEARGMVQKLMTGDRQGYSTLTGTSAVRSMKTSMRYVLFPVWVMTYQGEKTEPYYYMMNGQTGSVCGKLPLNRRKLFFVSLLTGILIFTLMCAGGAFLW